MKKEVRSFSGTATKREGDDGQRFITGIAAVYNTYSQVMYPDFQERLLPGCFDESIANAGRDIIATVNHDLHKVLGRRKSGTLYLRPDADSLYVECLASEVSFSRDLLIQVERGDIASMSFTFDVIEDEWYLKDGERFRDVKKADLYEVAWVIDPAYIETKAGTRSLESIKAFDERKVTLILRTKRMFLETLEKE